MRISLNTSVGLLVNHPLHVSITRSSQPACQSVHWPRWNLIDESPTWSWYGCRISPGERTIHLKRNTRKEQSRCLRWTRDRRRGPSRTRFANEQRRGKQWRMNSIYASIQLDYGNGIQLERRRSQTTAQLVWTLLRGQREKKYVRAEENSSYSPNASKKDLFVLFIAEIRVIYFALHQLTALRNVLIELKGRNRKSERERTGIQVDVISTRKIFDRIISFARMIRLSALAYSFAKHQRSHRWSRRVWRKRDEGKRCSTAQSDEENTRWLTDLCYTIRTNDELV